MIRRSLTRYIQRDIVSVVNRQTSVREVGDPKRYLSFGLRLNKRHEIEVTYRGTDTANNPWGSEIDYLGTVDLDDQIIEGSEVHDFRDQINRFLDTHAHDHEGIDILDEGDEPTKVETDDTDLSIE